jgi:hypothetical protein
MWLSVDPGLWKTGCATWTESGELISAWTARHKRETIPPVEAWRRMAQAVEVPEEPTVLVIEIMQVDGRTRGKEKGLFSLSGVIGALAMRFRDIPIISYTPREWKGSVPKALMKMRLEDGLTEAERARVCSKATHDAWDAVGIGAKHIRGIRPWRSTQS